MSHDHDHCNQLLNERLRRAATEGCEESKLLLSRRSMMGISAGLFSWACMPRWAQAASDDPRLLVVILRGGMDGLNVAVPHGDTAYVSMRGDLAIPKASTIALDSFFGLHPALTRFGAMYAAKDAAIVHACGTPLRNRSHFDCQDNLENGMPGDKLYPLATGWLNRLLQALPSGNPVRMQGAIQINEAPLILRGEAPVLGWSQTWFDNVEGTLLSSVRSLYKTSDPTMSETLEAGIAANKLASKYAGNGDAVSGLRQAFRGAGALISAATGPRIAVLSVDGWDTHADQGAATGYMSEVLTELDLALNDFKVAVGVNWSKTVAICASEFGRTVRTNGDSGTDHGVGTTVLMCGGAVNGGKVYGDWPGIKANQLYEDSDLKPTTDVRSVFKGILRDHIGVGNATLNSKIFPGTNSTTNAPALAHLIKAGGAASPNLEAERAVATKEEAPIARYRRGVKVTKQQIAAAN